MPQPVRIFYSYAHEDEELLRRLKTHLAEVRRQGLVEEWFDREITPGQEWAGAIDAALEQADLVLLLVSADFLDSGYCNGVELKRALERAVAGEVRILPVYLRPAVWQGAPFAGFEGLPKDARPVTDYPDRDTAWVEVVEGIIVAAREIRRVAEAKKVPPAPTPEPKPKPKPRRRNAALALTAAALAAVVMLVKLLWPDPALQQLLDEGNVFLDTGRYEQALASFDEALTLKPDHAGARFGRAKARIFAHPDDPFDVEAAATRLRTLETHHPDDPHVQLMVARLDAAGGDHEAAAARYRRALELDPGVAQAWWGLGVLAQGAGHPEEALEHYRRAVAIAPEQRLYLTNLASVFLELGGFDEALESYQRILEQDPHLLLPLLDAGNAARLAGELESAAWYHERLLQGVNDPGRLTAGDNAQPWVFRVGEETLELASPRSKFRYSLLTVALTRFLQGRRAEAGEVVEAAGGADLQRTMAVVGEDLRRLAVVRPEWVGAMDDFLRLVGQRAE